MRLFSSRLSDSDTLRQHARLLQILYGIPFSAYQWETATKGFFLTKFLQVISFSAILLVVNISQPASVAFAAKLLRQADEQHPSRPLCIQPHLQVLGVHDAGLPADYYRMLDVFHQFHTCRCDEHGLSDSSSEEECEVNTALPLSSTHASPDESTIPSNVNWRLMFIQTYRTRTPAMDEVVHYSQVSRSALSEPHPVLRDTMEQLRRGVLQYQLKLHNAHSTQQRLSARLNRIWQKRDRETQANKRKIRQFNAFRFQAAI